MSQPQDRRGSDPELEIYRSVIDTPTEFQNGFTWVAVAGAFFCGLLMMPGAIYLSLITGGGIAAAWVTLIIFSEISRRAMRTLSKQELVILLMVAGAMAAGGPAGDLIWRQYFVQSDAVRDIGLLGKFPAWYAPSPGSEALRTRSLLHGSWLTPILLVTFMAIVGKIKYYTLSYVFFRITSDIERLPFPFASINAQGATALAESGERKTTWKWRVFSLGAMIGLAFGVLHIGIPLVTGALLTKPIRLIPLPWFDATAITESLLPATPIGIVFDLGLVITGMVVPFWAVMGTGVAMLLTLFLNPMLHEAGILTRWQPGMDVVATTFSNSIDFWMSFGLGATLAIAFVSIFQTVRDLIRKAREFRQQRATTARTERLWDTPQGRGDYPLWIALLIYVLCASSIIAVSQRLVPEFPVVFLFFFVFLYTPLITYINARLIGICGQNVNIPFVREAAFILSGYKGVEIWLAPVPIDDYGSGAQDFRSNELTGTRFTSYVKAQALIVPLSLLLSFVFWGFIWKSGAIPSDAFPFAQKMWELRARNTVLLYSATLESGGATPLFFQALKPPFIATGFGVTAAGFGLLSLFHLPVMAIYGFLQGIGNVPHNFVPLVVGAFLGRFYFRRKFGEKRFLQMAPVVAAGYGTGIGLIALLGVAINLIVSAVSASPL